MAKDLGPTFADEITVAGIARCLAWGAADGTIVRRDRLTDEENESLDEVIAAHDPTLTAVPHDVSRRQYYQALAELGYITQDEARDAMADPNWMLNRLQPTVDALPPDERFAAEMKALGSVVIERYDSVIDDYLASIGMTPRQIDDLFRHAAAL